jgi:hypothetical protein
VGYVQADYPLHPKGNRIRGIEGVLPQSQRLHPSRTLGSIRSIAGICRLLHSDEQRTGRLHPLPPSNNLFEAWEAIDPSVDNVMRRILTERCGPLESALYRVFVKATNEHPIEAVLTWCNVPSLSTVAAQFGVRVIHSELGPLRAPCYHWTAYFDYSGVNGNTESRHRFASFDLSRQTEEVPLLSTKELRDLFVIDSALAGITTRPEFSRSGCHSRLKMTRTSLPLLTVGPMTS